MTITIGNTYQSRALLSFPLLLLLSLIDDFLSMRVNTPSACINTCRSRFYLPIPTTRACVVLTSFVLFDR